MPRKKTSHDVSRAYQGPLLSILGRMSRLVTATEFLQKWWMSTLSRWKVFSYSGNCSQGEEWDSYAVGQQTGSDWAILYLLSILLSASCLFLSLSRRSLSVLYPNPPSISPASCPIPRPTFTHWRNATFLPSETKERHKAVSKCAALTSKQKFRTLKKSEI